MARGFGARERVGFEKPRTFLGKIKDEIKKAMGRVAELEKSGRTFDLEAASYALERALLKMQEYESKRKGFGAAEAKPWDLVKNFGLTQQEADHQMMFGTYLLDRMEGLMKEINAPGKLRRPEAFRQATQENKPATAESVAQSFNDKWNNEKEGMNKLEEAGKFAKGTTVKEVQQNVADLANDLFKLVAGGNMGLQAQRAIEEASASRFKDWVDKGVSRKNAAAFLGMAQAIVSVKVEAADKRSREILLEEAGFGKERA